jgi:nicotinamidase-related amidase
MDALLVVDMQQGLLRGEPKHELDEVVARINRLGARVRRRGGRVIFIQHGGPPGDDFEPQTPGWALLRSIQRLPGDKVVHKTLNDAFFDTSLEASLTALSPDRVLITGFATDFCVDACVRSAAARGFNVVAVGDCHTLSDRPHLRAPLVIEHHHYIWKHLITPQPVTVAYESEL